MKAGATLSKKRGGSTVADVLAPVSRRKNGPKSARHKKAVYYAAQQYVQQEAIKNTVKRRGREVGFLTCLWSISVNVRLRRDSGVIFTA